jgi:hypothetical protein
MSEPREKDRPSERGQGVHARLAEEAEVRWAARTPSRSARVAGWVLCVALAVGVVVAALRVGLW